MQLCQPKKKNRKMSRLNSRKELSEHQDYVVLTSEDPILGNWKVQTLSCAGSGGYFIKNKFPSNDKNCHLFFFGGGGDITKFR